MYTLLISALGKIWAKKWTLSNILLLNCYDVFVSYHFINYELTHQHPSKTYIIIFFNCLMPDNFIC